MCFETLFQTFEDLISFQTEVLKLDLWLISLPCLSHSLKDVLFLHDRARWLGSGKLLLEVDFCKSILDSGEHFLRIDRIP